MYVLCNAKKEEPKIDKIIHLSNELLEVQGRGKDNVTLDADNTRRKLVLELSVTNTLGGTRHLSQQLLQPSERTNEGSFKHVSHLADLRETGSL